MIWGSSGLVMSQQRQRQIARIAGVGTVERILQAFAAPNRERDVALDGNVQDLVRVGDLHRFHQGEVGRVGSIDHQDPPGPALRVASGGRGAGDVRGRIVDERAAGLSRVAAIRGASVVEQHVGHLGAAESLTSREITSPNWSKMLPPHQ